MMMMMMMMMMMFVRMRNVKKIGDFLQCPFKSAFGTFNSQHCPIHRDSNLSSWPAWLSSTFKVMDKQKHIHQPFTFLFMFYINCVTFPVENFSHRVTKCFLFCPDSSKVTGRITAYMCFLLQLVPCNALLKQEVGQCLKYSLAW
jgi:hypothetical protein